MDTAAVSSKGQIVIPAKLREKYGIKAGTRMSICDVKGELRMVPITEGTIDENVGFLGTKGKLLKALMREKAEEHRR